jgi:ApaG protein
MQRHWLFTDANGKEQEVHGDGVVGEQPRLQPGQGFRYSSGTILETPAMAGITMAPTTASTDALIARSGRIPAAPLSGAFAIGDVQAGRELTPLDGRT